MSATITINATESRHALPMWTCEVSVNGDTASDPTPRPYYHEAADIAEKLYIGLVRKAGDERVKARKAANA